ncbi:MAG: hypothetical protein PWQ55_2411 [Chloroflexota bacterium]|nr:hypothetical protein [Chloroflexota bacterium]
MEQEIFETLQDRLASAEILEYVARNTDDSTEQGVSVRDDLFDQCWQEYGEVEDTLRKLLALEDCDELQDLLAQVLLDRHIHPNSGLVRDSAALWEAQYRWLHLYYRSGEERFMEQAKLCDSIRHAQVEKVEEEED